MLQVQDPTALQIAALRAALESASAVATNSESALNRVKLTAEAERRRADAVGAELTREQQRTAQFAAEVGKERARAAKFEREWASIVQRVAQLEAQLRQARQQVSTTTDEGLASALVVENMQAENKRLRTMIADMTRDAQLAKDEVKSLRAKLAPLALAPAPVLEAEEPEINVADMEIQPAETIRRGR